MFTGRDSVQNIALYAKHGYEHQHDQTAGDLTYAFLRKLLGDRRRLRAMPVRAARLGTPDDLAGDPGDVRPASAGCRRRRRGRRVAQRGSGAHVPVRPSSTSSGTRREAPASSTTRPPAGAGPRRWTPVPRVLDVGSDDEGAWLVTAASRAAARWTRAGSPTPDVAVRAIGAGLRALHDALPVAECPFDWGVPARAPGARPVRRPRVARGPARPTVSSCATATLLAQHPARRRRTLGRARRPRFARGRGPLGRPGRRGVERRVELRPGSRGRPPDSYGIAPDAERSAYYRALWDAT